MDIFMKSLKEFRLAKGYTQKLMGELLGMTQQGYASYENGKTKPDPATLVKIARTFSCSVDQLLGVGGDKASTVVPVKKAQLLSDISALAGHQGRFVDEIELGSAFPLEEHFAMLVTGDTMYPYYLDGDIVIVRRQNNAQTGEDVVVCVGAATAMVKRFYRSNLGVTLRDLNPACEAAFYNAEEIESLPLHILGIVVELRRRM